MKNYRHSHDDGDARINITFKNTFLAYALCAAAVLIGAGWMASRLPSDVPPEVAPVEQVAPPNKRQAPVKRQAQVDAAAARAAIRNRAYELQSGYCSRYVRQVVTRRKGGAKYGYLFGASAKITANNFLDSPWGYHWPAEKSKLVFIKPGDILFKRYGSGGYGHVGIYVGDVKGVGKMLVAENSSTSIGRISGAKGYRTLGQFNKDKGVDVVGRLPEPAKPVVTDVPKRVLK